MQDLHGYPAPVVRRRGRRAAAPAVPVLDPVEHYQRFYHARTAVQMKQQELVAIMADPKSAPDSDDEEDLEMWKVAPIRTFVYLYIPIFTYLPTSTCFYLYLPIFSKNTALAPGCQGWVQPLAFILSSFCMMPAFCSRQ